MEDAPGSVSPIASAVKRFRHEFVHYIEHGRAIDGVHTPPIHGISHGAATHV